VTACTSYREIGIGRVDHEEKVRVTTVDRERDTIHDPVVEADSIRGRDSEAIPLDQVSVIEVGETNWTPLLIAIPLAALATVLVVRLVECATNSYGSEC